MRALQLTGWQQPPQLVDVPEPVARGEQVLLRVGGAGVCHSDLHLLHFPPGAAPFEPPFTLGHENAGWVEAIGPDVRDLEMGQPVAVYGHWGCGACGRCQQGMENYCEHKHLNPKAGGGIGWDGGMAELLLVPHARLLVPLGELDPVEAAPLTDAGLTAFHAVSRSLPLLVAGSTVLVVGVGGLGHLAVQLLSALSPASIIAVDQRASALANALAHGAQHAVTSGPDVHAQIRDLTGGQGADVVLDFVGSDETMALAMAAARTFAQVTIVGIAGGTYRFNCHLAPHEVSLSTTYWGSLPELREVLALAAAGTVKAEIETFTLDTAVTAFEKLAAGQISGRAVVVP